MGAWIAVAVGGAMGSVARFWLASVMTALTGPRFPWGTLLINVLGSFVIGLVAGITLTPARVGCRTIVTIDPLREKTDPESLYMRPHRTYMRLPLPHGTSNRKAAFNIDAERHLEVP